MVDNCGVDWNEQSTKLAESYLCICKRTKQEMIEQLLYDGFTQEQAEYGAKIIDVEN